MADGWLRSHYEENHSRNLCCWIGYQWCTIPASCQCYTHPADPSGCEHWHRGGEHSANTPNTHAFSLIQLPGLQNCKNSHTLSLYVSMSLFLLVSGLKNPLRLWQRLYLAAAVLFRCSDVSHGFPQLFYQVILSGRQPRTAALFILCYRDRGIGSPDHHFEDMQSRGKDSLQRLHLLSPAFPQLLWSSSWTQES